MKNLLIALLIAALGFALGWYMKPAKTQTTYVDYRFEDRDVFENKLLVPVPVAHIIYDTETRIDTVEITKPIKLHRFHLAPPNPLTIDRDRVSYLSYDPLLNRWHKALFDVPKRTFFYGLDFYAGAGARWYDPQFYVTGLRGWARKGRFTIFADLNIVPNEDLILSAGLQFNLFDQGIN